MTNQKWCGSYQWIVLLCCHVFQSTKKVIIERVESLEKTISSRQILQTSTESTAHWLDNLQAQIQAATIPSGSSVQDAEQSVQKFEACYKLVE